MIFSSTLPFLLTLSSLLSLIFAIEPDANLTTSDPPSQCLSAAPMLGSDMPVDPVQHRDWSGRMVPTDCQDAEYLFRSNILSYDKNAPRTFWSRQLAPKPAGASFALPYGAKSQTCTLLLRMAKDFGDNVLPLRDGGFLQGSRRAAQAVLRWEDILWVLGDMHRAPQPFAKPIWTTALGVQGGNAVIMFIPSESVMARRWAADINQPATVLLRGSVVGVGNETDTDTGSTATS